MKKRRLLADVMQEFKMLMKSVIANCIDLGTNLPTRTTDVPMEPKRCNTDIVFF